MAVNKNLKDLYMLNGKMPFLHPLLKHYQWTVRDVIDMSMAIGVAPPVLINIVSGRMRSNDAIDQLLTPYMTQEEIKGIREDFDPFREIISADVNDEEWTIIPELPASDLREGHAIRASMNNGRDTRWILVTEVRRTGRRVHIFSGEYIVASVNEKVFFIGAKSKKKFEKYVSPGNTLEDMSKAGWEAFNRLR